MRVLRHPALQRLLSFGLLVSLGLWLAVPASAARTALAVEPAELGLPADAQDAVREALAAARSATDFADALASALGARPDGADLAERIADEPDALLALLYGHLFQAFGHFDGPVAVPAGAAVAASGAPLSAAAVVAEAEQGGAASGEAYAGAASPAVLSAPLLTAAQPRGP